MVTFRKPVTPTVGYDETSFTIIDVTMTSRHELSVVKHVSMAQPILQKRPYEKMIKYRKMMWTQ